MITLAIYDRDTGKPLGIKTITNRISMRAINIWCNRHYVDAEIITNR